MSNTTPGQLRIFFSYAENAGETRAMLQAAQLQQKCGRRVAVAALPAAIDAATAHLADGFVRLPCRNAAAQPELDLDQILAEKPDLVVIAQLAHTNPEGFCHRRRYQDIQEILHQGIDVYTTASVSCIESLHDTVAAITGLSTADRIPDSVFDNAHQVTFIDEEPPLVSAAPYPLTQAQLTALREIALRRCADRLRLLSDRLSGSFHTGEHILVCLSSSPSNAKIIRTAAKMASAFHSRFTALFVETPYAPAPSPEDRRRLQQHQRLAEELGAAIEMVTGENVAVQIAEFARLSGVTKIVLGRSAAARRHPLEKPPLTEQLLSFVPELDIHIIPDHSAENGYRPRRKTPSRARSIFVNTSKSLLILLGTTVLSQMFYHLGFTEANIIMLYILGVLLTSVATSQRVYSLVSSVASVCIFNFLFTVPRFSFSAYETGYPVTFAVMFMTAYITGTFAIRYKEQAGQSAKIAYRTGILFETDQLLSKAQDKNEILHAAAGQITKLLQRNIVIFENRDGQLSPPQFFPITGDDETALSSQELEAATWTLLHNHAAGATTETLCEVRYLYLALRVDQRVYGVVGIDVGSSPLDPSEHSILLSMLGECALALENEKNAREKEAAAVLAESEQLRANLLRTISHDLRTPLTSISGNASNLLSNSAQFDEATRQQIYTDIYEDSLWLINLVENLLSATRIEEGRMTLHTSTELLEDIVEAAVSHSRRKAQHHLISTVCQDELLLVRADARLIVQVLVNLIDNAIKYTPPGSSIRIATCKQGRMAHIEVADDGPGIPPEDREKIFEKFYCGAHPIADNRRSIGLGLYLCRAIVEAHGGTISVSDHLPHGTVFRFTLPCQEVTLHE